MGKGWWSLQPRKKKLKLNQLKEKSWLVDFSHVLGRVGDSASANSKSCWVSCDRHSVRRAPVWVSCDRVWVRCERVLGQM